MGIWLITFEQLHQFMKVGNDKERISLSKEVFNNQCLDGDVETIEELFAKWRKDGREKSTI